MRTSQAALLVCSTCYALGCSEDPTIWSSEVRSPNGQWVAYAHTVRHGGFGTAGVETLVELRLQSGLRDKIQILAFADGGDFMNLRMFWLSPSQLHVTYADDPSMLYFQVVKTSGVDVTVSDVDPHPARGRQPKPVPHTGVDRLAGPR